MAGAPSTPREAAVKIVRTLRGAGYVAYLAGGCVRDMLLGLTPQDFDVAADAKPDAIRALFHRTRFVGEAFGVVLVHLLGHDVEVATFRAESGYDDGRRPSHVEFTDARHDALRRDFTINGLFADPLSDGEPQVIDFVGGRADLQARLIRAIGDPRERFAEDFLRLLRAVRFAARLEFTIEEQTARAIAQQAPNLARISRERIGQEVSLMLSHPHRQRAAGLIQELGLDAPTLQEEHRLTGLATLGGLPADAPWPVPLAAWLLDRHGPPAPVQPRDPAELTLNLQTFVKFDLLEILANWRVALCLSNEHRDSLQAMLALLPRATNWANLDLAGRKRLLAEPAWSHTLTLLRALRNRLDVNSVLQVIDADMPTLIGQGIAPQPWINGDDLIALGRRPGPDFKRLLDAVYDLQLDGTLKNRLAALDWLKQQA